MRQLAVLDPKADGSARVIAGDGVDAETDQLHDIQSGFDRADNFFGRICAGFEIEICWTDGDDAGPRTTAVPCRSRSQFSRGVRAVEIIPESAVFDDGRRLSRYAFIVKRTGAQAGRHSSVIDERDVGRGNRLADL